MTFKIPSIYLFLCLFFGKQNENFQECSTDGFSRVRGGGGLKRISVQSKEDEIWDFRKRFIGISCCVVKFCWTDEGHNCDDYHSATITVDHLSNKRIVHTA